MAKAQNAKEKKVTETSAEKAAQTEETKKTEETTAQGGTAPEAPQGGTAPESKSDDQGAGKNAEKETLYPLDVLAGEFRVPSWQAAALHRMMNWAPGKKVTKKEYAAAVGALKNRRLGG